MGFIDNVSGGFAVAFGVTAVIAIANGLSTYVFDGQTLSDKVTSSIGGGSSCLREFSQTYPPLDWWITLD